MSVDFPDTHRSAYLLRPGVVEVSTVPVPRPGQGEVLVRVECALAGGTDRKAFFRGHPQIPMPGPFGHRYAGRVAAVGNGAPSFAIGEPIMGVHSAPCLTCSLCRRGRQHLCPDVMREKVLGAFGQYLCIPAPVARHNLFSRPDALSAEHATFLEPLACVVHGLEMIDWQSVESVFVLGLGAMGLLFSRMIPHYTSADRFAAGRRTPRVEQARRFGIDPVADLTTAPLSEQWHADEMFDVVIECTGKVEGWQDAFARAAPGGQVLLFGGLPRDTAFAVDTYRLHYEEIRLLGDFHFGPRDVAMARDYLLAGAIDPDPLISGVLPLEALPTAFERMQSGEGMQYIIDPWAAT